MRLDLWTGLIAAFISVIVNNLKLSIFVNTIGIEQVNKTIVNIT